MASAPPSRRKSRWTGLTADERRRERRRLLINTGFDLLGTGGLGTTVRAVCAAAELNPRYFYESFEDLDELVVAVFDDVMRQLQRRVSDAVAAAEPGDREAAMRATVEATVLFVDEDRRRGRVLYVEALGNEALNRRRVEAGFSTVDYVERDPDRKWAGDAEPAVARLGAAVVVGGLSEILSAWLDGRLDLSREELIEHATAVFLAVQDAIRGAANT